MTGSNQHPKRTGRSTRFIERLDPGERLGELLFGLIMVLTFTLGAGIGLADSEDARDLLVAALGCNTAWGIIDAALYLIDRLSERGRLHRLVRSIQASPGRDEALALVERELDGRLPDVVKAEVRAALEAHVLERVLELKLERNRVTADDLLAGLAVFWLVFLTALPPVVPFLLLDDPRVALRTSNALLIGLLAYLGWLWAGYTGASRWRTALFITGFCVALVAVAIALGG